MISGGAIEQLIHEKVQMTRTATNSQRQAGTCEVLLFNEERVRRVREQMLSAFELQELADTFKLLAHPTRIRILRALSEEELCVCDLAQVLGLSVSATSHQLQAMRRMKLVRYRMAGKLAYYSMSDHYVLDLLNDALGHLTSGGAAE
jgi:DNA-binding transcriptional ArsR family regulator